VGAFRERQLSQALTVIPGLVLAVLQVAVLSAVATALSTRFSAAASVALSLAAFVVGHLTVFLEGAVQAAGGLAVALIQAVLTIMPFLEIFNINQKLSHAILTPLEAGSRGAAEWTAVWCYVGLSALFALAYSAAAVSVGILLFRRRSLS
jgi:hypothetical protein